MLGFFKKKVANMMDSKRTTDECLDLWARLSERDRTTCAQNILRISRAMRDHHQTSTDATQMLGEYKQDIIRKNNLKNHMHPSFMEVQILMDLLYTDKRPETEYFDYTLSAFKEITARLTPVEIQELQSNLTKFIRSDSFFVHAKRDEPVTDAESSTEDSDWPNTVTDNFTAMRRVCGHCGAQVNTPRYAPRPTREGHDYPPFLRTRNYVPAPPIPDAEITRFDTDELSRLLNNPAMWPKNGDKWDQSEICALLEAGHVCSRGSRSSSSLGSNTIEEAPYLERPIEVHEYMTKYRVNRKAVEHAILKARVRAELIDGTLWLEDRRFK